MAFVMQELVLPLLLALLLGLALGWLMWRWRHRQVTSLEWDSVLAESSARLRRVRELEDLVGNTERDVVALSARGDMPEQVTALKDALAAAQRRIVELESKVGDSDDLKEIKGIGPKLEQILHDAGITKFAQLADLDGPGIEALQERLPQFPGKVERDDWVGQAKRLMGR